VLGSLALYGLNVVGNQYIDFRIIGEPRRLVPELDLVILTAAALALTWIFRRGGWARALAVVLALACFVPAKGYVRRAWQVLPPRDDHRRRIEYRLTEWIHANLPGVRCLATGSLRFWYNAWRDLPQLGGGSEQGLLNRWAQDAYVSPTGADDSPQQSIAWMQAMGVGALIVHDKTSQEIYKDWVNPAKFDGVLEKIYDSGEGDRIFLVPRRYHAPARVVDGAALRAVRDIDGTTLRRYADLVERGPETAPAFEAIGTDAMRVRARLGPGELLVVQQTYDPAWRAYEGARKVAVTKDAMNFLVLDPGPGEHEVLLRFETPLENRAGAAAGAAALLAMGGLCWLGRRRT
jgi:hypothetical protein